ncbi:MAG TPA: thiamine phosphate synthase [Thermoanaerobaculia bacterium]|nr:thiamine phosphate synthase [Thermoanaerobaculia bacterium]
MTRPPRPPRLYAIADRQALADLPLERAVATMAEEGVGWIQVRAKRTPGEQLRRELEACCRRLEGTGVALWVDDRVDLAALLPVAGVHVGQEDLPPADSRRLLGRERWIGLSTHSADQAAAAAADEAVDLLAVGPVFATASKERPDPVVGLELVREARRLTDKPLAAIGGIDADSAPRVLAAGADAVAVLGALCRGDLRANCRRLLEAVR